MSFFDPAVNLSQESIVKNNLDMSLCHPLILGGRGGGAKDFGIDFKKGELIKIEIKRGKPYFKGGPKI